AAYRIRVVSRPRDSAVLGSSFPQFNVNGGCGARAAAAPLQRAVARSPPGSRARQADSASQEELKMRAEKQVPQCQPASENLVQLLQRRAKDSAKVAATHKRGDGWADVTWGAILEEVKKVSAGLTAWGSGLVIASLCSRPPTCSGSFATSPSPPPARSPFRSTPRTRPTRFATS